MTMMINDSSARNCIKAVRLLPKPAKDEPLSKPARINKNGPRASRRNIASTSLLRRAFLSIRFKIVLKRRGRSNKQYAQTCMKVRVWCRHLLLRVRLRVWLKHGRSFQDENTITMIKIRKYEGLSVFAIGQEMNVPRNGFPLFVINFDKNFPAF